MIGLDNPEMDTVISSTTVAVIDTIKREVIAQMGGRLPDEHAVVEFEVQQQVTRVIASLITRLPSKYASTDGSLHVAVETGGKVHDIKMWIR